MHGSVVQVDASQGRRGRDTGSYVDRVIGLLYRAGRSGLKMVVGRPLTSFLRGSGEAVTESGAGSLGPASVSPLSARTRFRCFPRRSAGSRAVSVLIGGGVAVLEETNDREEIIERVAALDIGKAELVCCVRVPGAEGRPGRRCRRSRPTQTMTRSLLRHGRPAARAWG